MRRADTRVLAATNADLHAAVKAGAFREDLLHRLNTVEVALPPLRDRREDVPALASAFLATQAARYRKSVQRFGAAALKALSSTWPGNVRELEHCVERAVLMARGTELTPEDLVLRPRDGARVEDMPSRMPSATSSSGRSGAPTKRATRRRSSACPGALPSAPAGTG